jgi:hypothetical protein
LAANVGFDRTLVQALSGPALGRKPPTRPNILEFSEFNHGLVFILAHIFQAADSRKLALQPWPLTVAEEFLA